MTLRQSCPAAPNRRRIAGTLAASLLAATLAAMPTPGLARTPEAATPASTMPQILRRVSLTGTTKPDGAALDARLGTSPSLDAASRRLDHLIRTGICTRC